MNYIEQLPQLAAFDKIIAAQKKLQTWVSQNKKGFLRYRLPCEGLQQFPAEYLQFEEEKVTIGKAEERTAAERTEIESHLRSFIPWRKGPFSIYDIYVDSEWQSGRKWQRLVDFLPDLQGKIIADIGCSNGYYMFRMVPCKPKIVIGFEPSVQHYYCFKGLNGMAGQKNLHIDLLGVQHLPIFPERLDFFFFMGISFT